jgi:hypothetical protein
MQNEAEQAQARPRYARKSSGHVIPPRGFFGKLLGVVIGLLVMTVVFAFSLVLLVVVAVAGLAFWGYLKYRASVLRRAEARGDYGWARRADHGQGPHHRGSDDYVPAGGLIIEGEASRTDPPKTT